NKETQVLEVVPFEEQSDDLKKKLAKNNEAKMREKVTSIEESKDLSSLALDELNGNLKVHEFAMEKDFEICRGKKKRVKSIALKAKKESSDDETSTSESDDEEYVMAVRNFKRCGDLNHLIGNCPKPPRNKDQKAFIGGSWSDSKNDAEDKINDETCLMAQSSNEDEEIFGKLSDDDVIRLCLLLALEVIFMGRLLTFIVDDTLFSLFENIEAWNSFPWGEHLWCHLYDEIKNLKERHGDEHYYGLFKDRNYVLTYTLVPPIKEHHDFFETYISKLEKARKCGKTSFMVSSIGGTTDNSVRKKWLNDLVIMELNFHLFKLETNIQDYLREEELRLCLEGEEKMCCKHQKLIVEENRIRLDEAKRLRERYTTTWSEVDQSGEVTFYDTGHTYDYDYRDWSTVVVESVRLLQKFQQDDLESSRGMVRLICETQLKKPSTSSMDNSKRIDDSTKNYSLFEVNYDGMFDERPLRYAYGKFLPLKLSNSNMMTYSELLDMLVYKPECKIQALFYSIPRNSLETGLTIVECDNDVKKMYDTAKFWSYEDVYSDGYFDVSGSFKRFNCIKEHVGYDDGSLPVKNKDEFENEVILDDVVTSPATLSMLLKRKEVILRTDDETSSNDEISSSEDLINYLSARDVEWILPKNTQEEPPKSHYDPIKTEVEEPLPLDIVYTHSHVASSVMGTNRTGKTHYGLRSLGPLKEEMVHAKKSYNMVKVTNELFYRKRKKSLEKGSKLLHTDNDVHSFIDAAVTNGFINLYVAHKKQNLGKYYYKNMELEEDDAGLRCSSLTPFSTRVKTKISKRKKTSVIHDEGDDRKKSLVTGGRKGNEKLIEDEGICSKGNKADVTIYKRDMVNEKAKIVEDVGVL
nr:phospholipase-like protein [Tanacetum cinerariifolium]